MTHDSVPYAYGNFYSWWPNAADYTENASYNPNNPDIGDHNFGPTMYQNYTKACFHIRPWQTGLMPTGFPAAGIYQNEYLTTTMYPRGNANDDYSSTKTGGLLNYMAGLGNPSTTGGTALHGLPVFFRKDNTSVDADHFMLGVMPDIRLVDMADYAPGDEVTYGEDTWVVFPWVSNGAWGQMGYGASPDWRPNTGDYGIAFKKVV
jgi:hypothetical protein